MPPLGQTSDELRIVAWRKVPGDAVVEGEPLLEVETDKATLEVEAAGTGTLLSVVHGEGETVTVGTVIAYLGAPGEEVEAVAAIPPKVLAAPAVRRLAREHGVGLADLAGSGPGGRIERADVLAAAAGPRATAGEPVSRHRLALASRLNRSAAIPQFTLGVTVDMTSAAAVVEREPDVTYTQLLLRAAASALRLHPALNRVWVEGAGGPWLRVLERADIGLAVAGEDTLLVVTIQEPDRLTLAELAAEVAQAVGDARAGVVSERRHAPVAVTLSNLGGIDVDRFAAVVDPDQTAILAAGRVAVRPAVVAGDLRAVPQLELSLTADHRVVDGLAAGRYLAAVRAALEG
jgi:pyruvate dehydrogenase E2 component (dihydrolipoyllysine-residue acetyltransferase)